MHKNGPKGYPWLFFYAGLSWVAGLIVTLIVIVSAGVFYVWYSPFSNDASPDSLAGYAYAIVGTLCLILAAILYSWRRRSRNKRVPGRLNAALNWHIFLAIIGLALLLMHSFGNLNPRTGTYALYGMVALTVSGFVGRMLDRLMPRLIANEVNKALTMQGEDRIEDISQEIQAIVIHSTEKLQGFSAAPSRTSTSFVSLPGSTSNGIPFDSSRSLHTPWDLAYISLEETPQELNREAAQYRFIPDKKSALARPEALMPGAEEQMSELKKVQRAMQREKFYRYIIRYWRVVHISLALLTVALTIWHLVYAAQLLIPTFIH
jgi:uncharacterized membrane protein YjfL (UPF0719 family)